MDRVREILEKTFQENDWEVERPQEGWENTSYIVSRGTQKYFLKLGINPSIVQRLHELKVIPQIIALGEDYMVQEFIPEPYIAREWLGEHLDTLAHFITNYHKDSQLKEILRREVSEDKVSIEGELQQFLSQLSSLPSFPKEVEKGILDLTQRYQQLPSTALVSVHDDPNYKNIFLHDNKLFMIDWNNIRLSDEISDIGALLWWYVPQEKWKDFFVAYGVEFTTEITERVCLAAAKMSMGFSLWCLQHNVDHSQSFHDFREAFKRKSNPRAWYNR